MKKFLIVAIAESVLATGSGTQENPGLLTFEWQVPFQGVVKIRTVE